MLDYGLAKAADSIFKHVITPAVTHASTFVAVEDSSITEATLKLDLSSHHKVAISVVIIKSCLLLYVLLVFSALVLVF